MNIKITYNWLLEYLDTDADPYEIQQYLSLCGPSVERVEKVGEDYVLDIEITSNRVDSASVFGIAQECSAILPQFGKKATLTFNPLEKYTFGSIAPVSTQNAFTADIKLLDKSLASRVTAVIMSTISIGQSPQFMQERLMMCGIKSINNVVDISNYLMLALGQPNHTFDYDKIVKHKLHIRESKAGEKVTTLDEEEIILSGGDIVIEDGSGNLTDLAGIMGGFDSMVSHTTKNVLLLLESYNAQKIRKTSMTTGQRTVAATYFEKGLDPNRIESTLVYGVNLLQEYAGAKVASNVIDLYSKPVKPKMLSVSITQILSLIGVNIPAKTMTDILQHLGFVVESVVDKLKITVPTYRLNDIETWHDIAEEIARIYGYFNIKGVVQTTRAHSGELGMRKRFSTEYTAKYYLKHVGLHEVYNYSMISRELIERFGLKEESFLKLKNTISQNIEYMRTSLIPSLTENISKNIGKNDSLTFFEIAKTYQKIDGELPVEKRQLGIISTTSYEHIKGVLEGLFRELHITNYSFEQNSTNTVFQKNMSAKIVFGDLYNGHIGLIAGTDDIYGVELDFDRLVLEASEIPSYKAPSPYSTIKLDLTVTSTPDHTFEKIKKTAFKTSKLLNDLSLVSTYKNKVTLQFEFTSNKRNITEDEAKEELEDIVTALG